jgi:chlorobactene glucosyltransferase
MFSSDSIALSAYALASSGAWSVLLFAMLKSRARLNLRVDLPDSIEAFPPVTVIVPCRNESANIRACCQSVLDQDYPNLELTVVNDRSTDDTGSILDTIARSDSRVRLIHIAPGNLPEGWFGKNFAMHRAAQLSQADWLVFTDSDCLLSPAAVRIGVMIGVHRRFDMVSLIPRFVPRGFADRLMTPLGGLVTGAMYAMMFANNARLPSVAFACGQYMAIRRSAYESVGGWASVRQYPSDDVEIARRLKSTGCRPRIGWGMDLVRSHMYDSWSTVWRGWGRNFIMASRGKPGRMILAIMFLVFCVFSIIPAAFCGVYAYDSRWIALAGLHAATVTIAIFSTYRWAKSDGWLAFLWPVSAVLMLAIFARSLYLCLIGSMDWRGVRYSLRMK